MLDGVVADHTGDMLEPYADMPGVTTLRTVDYKRLKPLCWKQTAKVSNAA